MKSRDEPAERELNQRSRTLKISASENRQQELPWSGNQIKIPVRSKAQKPDWFGVCGI